MVKKCCFWLIPILYFLRFLKQVTVAPSKTQLAWCLTHPPICSKSNAHSTVQSVHSKWWFQSSGFQHSWRFPFRPVRLGLYCDQNNRRHKIDSQICWFDFRTCTLKCASRLYNSCRLAILKWYHDTTYAEVWWICSLPKHLQLLTPPPLSSLPPPPSLLLRRLSRASFDRTLEAGDEWLEELPAEWFGLKFDTEKRGVHGGYIIWDDVNLMIFPLHSSLSLGQLASLGPFWWVYFQAQNQLMLFVW